MPWGMGSALAGIPSAQSGRRVVPSDDGAYEFYAEIDPLPERPTDFVRATVYPLLDRGAAAMGHGELANALRAFLTSVPEPSVLADNPNDLSLLQMALAGFGQTEQDSQGHDPILRPVMTHILKDGITQRVLEDWFRTHPAEKQRRHHALVDARALRAVWLALTGRGDGSWSPALKAWQG